MARLGRILLSTLLAPTSVLAQSSWTDRADSLAESLFRRLNPPALSIAVARTDGQTWRAQIGSADLEAGQHAGRETRFRVGSVSKLFSAAIAARLVAAGRLDLDAPISRYLPNLPAAYRAVTARMLAGHLAGVRHYGPGEFISRTAYPNVSASLGVFLNDSLLARPGTRYFYSSYGYNLLGAVLESAGGAPYPELLRREVFEPLKLRQTALEPSGRLGDGEARPYSADAAGKLQPSPVADLSDRWPSGGIISTAEELAQFGLGVLGSGYLPDSVRALFLSTQHTEAGAPTNVGLGWRIAKDSLGRRYLHHGGSAMGGRAFLLVYPDEGVAVAILANTEANLGESDALAFARLVLEAATRSPRQ